MKKTDGVERIVRGFYGVLIACIFLTGVSNSRLLADEGISEGLFDKLDLDIAVSGTFDFYNQYIWRGFALDTDAVFQPGFSLSGYGFTYTMWSNWDADNDDLLASDEIDYTFDYTKEFEGVKISLGHTYYDFPGTGLFSKELYAGIGFTKLPLTPVITFYHDYGNHRQGGGHGQYITVKLSKSITLIEDPAITLNLSVLNGINRHLFIRGTGGHTLFSAGITVPLIKNVSITPSVNYSLNYGDLKDPDDGNQKSRLYCGFSIAYAF